MLLLAGCATQPARVVTDAEDPAAAACLERFERLEHQLVAQGAADAAAHRVVGFPWLRNDRFLASFRGELESEEQWSSWLERLRSEDVRARRFELANLLDTAPQSGAVRERLARLERCGRLLNGVVLARPQLRERVIDAAEVPDEYRTGRRWLGLYPVARLFVGVGVRRLHRQQREALNEPIPAAGESWPHYLAAGARQLDGAPAPRALAHDALGVPEPGPEERRALLDRHAPLWRIETHGERDRIGAPVWSRPDRPEVETDEPVEFRYVSHARFGDAVLLQLNYLVWFPERPPQGPLDLSAGHLNGALWRVTLDAEGHVLAGENVHACGCYYMAFPGPGLMPGETRPPGEPLFAWRPLPMPRHGERLRLTRATGTHYLIHLDAVAPGALGEPVRSLAVRHADRLRSLAHPQGRRSLFRAGDGIVPGSERPERWLLWPMGVPSAGAMRHPARHAIAFIGRRHLDDPRLLERHFRRVAQTGE